MESGWWKLSYEFWDKDKDGASVNVLINDADREQISKWIKEGYIEGELQRVG